MIPSGRRILLVDDNPQVRNAWVRLLGPTRFEIEVAASAEEGLALASHQNYAFVFTDLRMPGLGGPALIQRLSRLQPDSRCYVVTSDRLWRPDPEIEHYVCGIVSKPWNDRRVLALINGTANDNGRSNAPLRAETSRKPLSVLIVEDSQSDAQELVTYLQQQADAPYEVRIVSQFYEAVRLLSEHAFDVVVSDLGRPNPEGFESALRLLSAGPTSALILVGERDSSELAISTIQAGAQNYLVKDKLKSTSLWRAIHQAIERKHAECQMMDLALTDPLTALANREHFRRRVAEALSLARSHTDQFAVLMLDVDRFKSINEGLGHDAGDAFLREVAVRIKGAVRDQDMVSRFGGDEFGILLSPLGAPQEAECIAARILQSLRDPFMLADTPICSTASIGVAVFPIAGQTTDVLFQAADAAMYQAKQSGRDSTCVYGDKLLETASERLRLETALRSALSRNEFFLCFQPQVELSGKRVIGLEALLRWRLDGGDVVAPDEFVPILEETDLIRPVGLWVLEDSLKTLRQLREAGFPVQRMSVNVSPRQLEDSDLVEAIHDALKANGLEPTDLELELTEAILVQNTPRIRNSLSRLWELGVRIAIDDFGTGYSSLAYLHQFPVSTLKIDRSFMADLGMDARRAAVVGTIIELGRRLDLEVIAEGVEKEAEAQWLISEGCDSAQGYFYGRPLPLCDLHDVLRSLGCGQP